VSPVCFLSAEAPGPSLKPCGKTACSSTARRALGMVSKWPAARVTKAMQAASMYTPGSACCQGLFTMQAGDTCKRGLSKYLDKCALTTCRQSRVCTLKRPAWLL